MCSLKCGRDSSVGICAVVCNCKHSWIEISGHSGVSTVL